PLTNLINGGSFNDCFAALINSRRISAQERQTVDAVRKQQDLVQADVDAIALKKQQQQAAHDQVNAQLTALNAQAATRQRALDALAARIAEDERKQAQAEEAKHQLELAVLSLINQKNALASGQFLWPDRGPISQGFGCTQY